MKDNPSVKSGQGDGVERGTEKLELPAPENGYWSWNLVEFAQLDCEIS